MTLSSSAPTPRPLTPKMRAALQAAAATGSLFQLPERPTHSPGVLSSLCKAGYLERARVGVVWCITEQGRAALAAASG